jgi:hypothetical protein
MYTCPMHPTVLSQKPGSCPFCGMRLVLKDNQNIYPHEEKNSYAPLFIIIGVILLTTIAIAFRETKLMTFTPKGTIENFMIGFFLVFSGFKLIDIHGFAQAYRTYDIVAIRWFGWGYVYPFVELLFGLSMILFPSNLLVLWLEVIIMGISGIGVALKLAKKEKFRCACLGTSIKIPLTSVTLIEDFGMAALAATLIAL